MHLYQLIHTIKSPVIKQELEEYLQTLSKILSIEINNGRHTYEIQTNIRKKEFIRLSGIFVKKQSLTKDERVVLYDLRIQSDFFELPNKNEKIVLNGNIEKENQVEVIILEIFRYIQMKMKIEESEKEYFNSLTNNTHLN